MGSDIALKVALMQALVLCADKSALHWKFPVSFANLTGLVLAKFDLQNPSCLNACFLDFHCYTAVPRCEYSARLLPTQVAHFMSCII